MAVMSGIFFHLSVLLSKISCLSTHFKFYFLMYVCIYCCFIFLQVSIFSLPPFFGGAVIFSLEWQAESQLQPHLHADHLELGGKAL